MFARMADDNVVLPLFARRSPKPGLRTRIGHRLIQMGNAVAEARRRRAVIRELRMFSARELADIGLTRADLASVFDPDFAASRRCVARTCMNQSAV